MTVKAEKNHGSFILISVKDAAEAEKLKSLARKFNQASWTYDNKNLFTIDGVTRKEKAELRKSGYTFSTVRHPKS